MSATLTAAQLEAREMLAYFTSAPDGEAVMDGAGAIWHHSGGYWYAGRGLRGRRIASLDLARALCPDLAEHMVVTA